jgi:hypothetical protein
MDQTELINKLRKLDEVLLLELLEINSEQIVDAFMDQISERETYIRHEITDL